MSIARWSRRYNPREHYGDTLIRLARERPACVALAADLAYSCGIGRFNEALPGRCINVGVAEQNMAGVAAGLALEGKIPWIVTIAPFISMRCCEQIRTDICYNRLHVVVASVFAGLSAAPLGATHYGIEDLGIFRSFGNMTILHPADAWEAERAMEAAMAAEGPVYLRLGGGSEPHLDLPEREFTLGRASCLRPGTDASLHATGYMVHKALEAAEELHGAGVEVSVYDHHTIKPVDATTITTAARTGGAVVTLEEHNIYGGLGTAIAEVLAEAGVAVPFVRLGIPDIFPGVGEREELLTKFGLDVPSIVNKVRDILP